MGDVFAAEGHLRVATKNVNKPLGSYVFPGPSGPDLEGVEKLMLEKVPASGDRRRPQILCSLTLVILGSPDNLPWGAACAHHQVFRFGPNDKSSQEQKIDPNTRNIVTLKIHES